MILSSHGLIHEVSVMSFLCWCLCSARPPFMLETLSRPWLKPHGVLPVTVSSDLWNGLVWAALPWAQGFMCHSGADASGCRSRGRLPYVHGNECIRKPDGGQPQGHEELQHANLEGLGTLCPLVYLSES